MTTKHNRNFSLLIWWHILINTPPRCRHSNHLAGPLSNPRDIQLQPNRHTWAYTYYVRWSEIPDVEGRDEISRIQHIYWTSPMSPICKYGCNWTNWITSSVEHMYHRGVNSNLLICSVVFAPWYPLFTWCTVKHKNPDLGMSDQKHSRTSKISEFCEKLRTVTCDLYYRTSKIPDFWPNQRFLEGAGWKYYCKFKNLSWNLISGHHHDCRTAWNSQHSPAWLRGGTGGKLWGI